MKRLLKEFWPIILLFLISFTLCLQNYTPGTILSGWDTLHPEFNFGDYFSRIFFGVWQQHQGLGALATQAHASEIARMFIYFPLSFILPENLLRYSYFFLTLILAPIGSYLFLKYTVFKENTLQNQITSFCGGLFYLLNLAVLQQYFVPFEMFATHFASLPFLFLFALLYLETNKRKFLIFYLITSFLSASIAHTATLWFVFFATFILFLLTYSAFKRSKKVFKNSLILIVYTLLINFFWLLPNLYFVITEGQAISNAKITSLFSEEAFAQNASFGTIPDLLIFKNFLFNWGQYVGQNKFGPLLFEWINHLNQPYVLLLGYFYSFVALIGIIYSLFKKNKMAIAFLTIFFVSCFFLLNINPPLGFVFSFLQAKLPFFKEAVRFPFTKFSLLLVFAFSFYFAWGLNFFIEASKKIKLEKIFKPLLLVIVLSSLVYYMLPAFQGNLINPNMRVKIPKEYFTMFDWFKNQPLKRVAPLPIQSFWGWQYYSWNYQGAGFLWFGIKQPLLDREFDRWNPYNEQYYREMSEAVYSQNISLFNQVVEKYDIGYILVDKNVINPGIGSDPKVLFFNEIDKLLKNSNQFKTVNRFGNNLFVYTRNENEKNFVSPVYILKNPYSVSPSTQAYYQDFAYTKYGNYTTNQKTNDTYFPFRDLIDNQNRILTDISIQNNGLVLNLDSSKGSLRLENLQSLENQISADLIVTKNVNSLDLKIYPSFPINNSAVLPIPISSQINIQGQKNLILSVNQTKNYFLNNISENTPFSLDKILLDTKNDNTISVYSLDQGQQAIPNFSDSIYKLDLCGSNGNPVFGIGNQNKNSFSLFGKNAQVCMTIPLSNIFPKIQDQFDNNAKELLLSLNFKYQGENNSSICITKLNEAGCLYYLSKNLNLNSLDSQQIYQYFGIKENEAKDLAIRIYLDTTKNNSLNKSYYSGFTFNLMKPISTTYISPSMLNTSLANVKINQQNNYQLSIPFSGIADLSKDITKLPKTTGDCPASNPRGANPTNKQIERNETNPYIRYSSTEGSFCDHFSYQNLNHNQAYLVSIISRNIQGLPIRLCVTNNSSTRCDIYTHLSKSSDFKNELFLLPPIGDGKGYDVNVNNFAIKRIPSVNDLKSIDIIPIPYEWLSQLEVNKNNNLIQKPEKIKPTSIVHPNQSLYLVTLSNDQLLGENNVLVLSQSFEKGWAAYQVNNLGILEQLFPFVFGRKLSNHFQVNDWSNGWSITVSSEKVIIVYLPQYLEYIGFVFLFLTVIYLIIKR